MSAEEPSIIIVGAGIFGTSTAYHLSKAYTDRTKITVLDPAPTPSADNPESRKGASSDINKIIRSDYSSEFYCRLAYEAIDAWATWPELSGFYHRTGWIMLDQEGSDLAKRIRETLKKVGGEDPTTDVPLEQLESRWGGILKGTKTKGFGDAYWNPEAGWCEASAATSSLMNAAIRSGVNYEVGECAELVLESGRVAGVKTLGGKVLNADKVVLATGAWTSLLMSPVEDQLRISEQDRVEQQAQAAGVVAVHYKMSSSELADLKEMPVVVYGENGEVIPPPRSNALLKFTNGKSFLNTVITPSGHKVSAPPPGRHQHEIPAGLMQETYERMMSRVMPSFTANSEPAYWRLCWDAYTPTQEWLLTKHPHEELGNLYFAVGGSFHSYKFLPNAGKYMVKVLEGESNGAERDAHWGWKKFGTNDKPRGAHENTRATRELRELEGDGGSL